MVGRALCAFAHPICRSAIRSGCILIARQASAIDSSVGRLRGVRFFRSLNVHPHHFPDMAVRIFETAAIHEAEVLLR